MAKVRAALQLVAVAMVGGGIAFECVTGAHLGYILVTSGALVFAISTKIRK